MRYLLCDFLAKSYKSRYRKSTKCSIPVGARSSTTLLNTALHNAPLTRPGADIVHRPIVSIRSRGGDMHLVQKQISHIDPSLVFVLSAQIESRSLVVAPQTNVFRRSKIFVWERKTAQFRDHIPMGRKWRSSRRRSQMAIDRKRGFPTWDGLGRLDRLVRCARAPSRRCATKCASESIMRPV